MTDSDTPKANGESEAASGANGSSAPAAANDDKVPEAAEAEGAGGSSPDLPVELPEQKIERLEGELKEQRDRMLRMAAEHENYKKRVRRDIEDANYQTKERILRELLPVLDNLERANDAVEEGGSLDSLSQGVKLVERQFFGGLEKFYVKGFESLGEPFDPNRHEAIQQVDTDEYDAGVVATVFARGYMVGERLLRPAMVGVASAGSKKAGGAVAESAESADASEETQASGSDETTDGGEGGSTS